ncbi:ABC transporter substrate-binding protein [Thermoactinomyces mirandus]|uniref:Extracellular solute-binding protein n=1 Tax=Thermoactinomyces mirandus TaxID=2756294 RepID=A0A7W2AQT1_9BACL|nr:extracellular solute-binding protein [Thermoactinomyces mirandus]MBA4600830.1 extracellular solute-binding protein [Thermoactinomyces mirandus]
MLEKRWLVITVVLLFGICLAVGLILWDPSSEGKDDAVTLTIYTVAGGDEYYKDIVIPMFEEKTNGKYQIEYGRGTAQEIINKIKTQGNSGTIDIVITGLDGLPLGIKEGLWEQLYPKYSNEIHANEWNEIGKAYIEKYDGYGAPVTTGSGGPVLVYNSKKVNNPPSTYAELKDWILKNPGRFTYAAVPSSGPARGFFFGLAQSLGEDFNNPDSLNETWKYLADIGKTIDYYPSKTSDTFDLLYEGEVDIIPHTPFWFANLVATNTVPSHIKAVALEDTKQIIDSHFYVMVKNLPEERKKAALEFLKFVTSKEIQAQGYAVGLIPANEKSSPALLESKYKKTYNHYLKGVMPDFKEKDTILVPENNWVLFPDLEVTNKLYNLWEQKIQAQK